MALPPASVYHWIVWRTIGFLLYFWPLLAASTSLLIPAGLFRLGGSAHLSDRLVGGVVQRWSRHMLRVLGARITVQGRENLPVTRRVCVVANHASYADSLLIEGYLGLTVGFIAKAELARIPALSIWMRAAHTVFVQRGNRRSARRALACAARNILHGHPMAVFPEGTRSRGRAAGMFKAAALRLAWDSGATIIPVSISGTADLLERQGYLRSADVAMEIHPPIAPAEYESWTRQELADRLRAVIVGAAGKPLRSRTRRAGSRYQTGCS